MSEQNRDSNILSNDLDYKSNIQELKFNEIDYQLLKFILEKNKKKEAFTQREIAKALKISLGMTNNILKKVVKRGFVLISHINGKKINYMLSSKGINEIYERSLNYFKRIAKNSYNFKNTICNLFFKLETKGYDSIILFGQSNIDFIIEYCCNKFNFKYKTVNVKNFNDIISYLKNKNKEFDESKIFYFIGESVSFISDEERYNFNKFIDEKLISITHLVKLINI